MNWNRNDSADDSFHHFQRNGDYYNRQPYTPNQQPWQPVFRELPTPPPPPRQSSPRKAKQYLTRGTAAAVLLFSMLTSSLLGFAGGLMASRLDPGGIPPTTQQQSMPAESTPATPMAAPGSFSVADVAAQAAPSVVEITTEVVSTGLRRGQYVSEGAGSGVIVSDDGYIITNNHVIDGASKITVRLKNGESYDAKLVATDPKTDVALLKIEATGLSAATFGDSDALMVGELAVAIGNPLGELGGTVTDGIISALDREIVLDGQTMNLLQTSAAINPGNSGGGLFNSKGELIGIVVAKSAGSDIEGLGFAIPSNDAKAVMEQLKNHGYVQGRVSMGVSLIEILDAQTAMSYRVRQLGVYVAQVNEGSPAQAAGLQAGDLLVSLDGKVIGRTTDVINHLTQRKVGDTVTLEVLRGGQSLLLPLTLGEDVPR